VIRPAHPGGTRTIRSARERRSSPRTWASARPRWRSPRRCASTTTARSTRTASYHDVVRALRGDEEAQFAQIKAAAALRAAKAALDPGSRLNPGVLLDA
jgi:hypothetical protein